MKILLVEDYSSLGHILRDSLERNHQVYYANDLFQAMDLWEEHQAELDCLILDLNMNPDGLTEAEEAETEYGLFTGWIWLQHYVLKGRAGFEKNTIIMTGHLDELKRKLAAAKEENLLLQGYSIVEKNQGNQIQKIFDSIQKVTKGLERSSS